MARYGKINYSKSTNRKSISLILAVIAMFVLLSPFAQGASIQKFGIDSGTYSSGDPISISGEILEGNSSGQIRIIIWQGPDPANETANKTIYANSGLFSTVIDAPSNPGEYAIAAIDNESGSTSPGLNFNVLRVMLLLIHII